MVLKGNFFDCAILFGLTILDSENIAITSLPDFFDDVVTTIEVHVRNRLWFVHLQVNRSSAIDYNMKINRIG